MTREQIEKAISLTHDVRYGGLPTHFPSLITWNEEALSKELQQHLWAESLAENPHREIGIYLNIPFCKKKCGFCFLDVLGSSSLEQQMAYVEALAAEINFLSPIFKNKEISCVYIGGGTPNYLPAKLLKKILFLLHDNFVLKQGLQISIEANPDFFDEEKVQVLASSGVNMALMGVQSFSAAINTANGRAQDVSKIKNAFSLLRNAGIKHINTDLLCGLNGQTKKDFLKDIVLISMLKPTQVHLNRIKPLQGTLPPEIKAELSEWQKEGLEILRRQGYTVLDEESACISGIRNIQGNYYFHLEHSLLGLGAGALSHAWGKLRYRNEVSPINYIEASNNGTPFSKLFLQIGLVEELIHYLMNTLLHGEVVKVEDIVCKFGNKCAEIYVNFAEELESKGYLQRVLGGWRCALRMQDWLGITAALYGDKLIEKIVGRYHL